MYKYKYVYVNSRGRWTKNGRAKEQNVESKRRIPFGKFLNYTCNISVRLKLQNKNGPLCFVFLLKYNMHSIFLKYCPPLLRSAPLSPTFHHPVQVKGHLPLLRQAHDPLHATDPSQLPPTSPDPTRESISVTGTWYTRDQSQNQQDPNFMGAARTRRKRCLSAGVCMKAD